MYQNVAIICVFYVIISGCISARSFNRNTGDTTSVIGNDDRVLVLNNKSNLPDKYKRLTEAFGLFKNGNMVCTATHIGNGIAITAGHCFKAAKNLERNIACNMDINWENLKDNNSNALISKCVIIVAQENSENSDFAIFKVDKYPQTHIEVESGKINSNLEVTIFGFPNSQTLTWSPMCNIESASILGLSDTQFLHKCDTEVGNSGSAVIDTATMKLIGVHDGNLTNNYNYGTFINSNFIEQMLEKN